MPCARAQGRHTSQGHGEPAASLCEHSHPLPPGGVSVHSRLTWAAPVYTLVPSTHEHAHRRLSNRSTYTCTGSGHTPVCVVYTHAQVHPCTCTHYSESTPSGCWGLVSNTLCHHMPPAAPGRVGAWNTEGSILRDPARVVPPTPGDLWLHRYCPQNPGPLQPVACPNSWASEPGGGGM